MCLVSTPDLSWSANVMSVRCSNTVGLSPWQWRYILCSKCNVSCNSKFQSFSSDQLWCCMKRKPYGVKDIWGYSNWTSQGHLSNFPTFYFSHFRVIFSVFATSCVSSFVYLCVSLNLSLQSLSSFLPQCELVVVSCWESQAATLSRYIINAYTLAVTYTHCTQNSHNINT